MVRAILSYLIVAIVVACPDKDYCETNASQTSVHASFLSISLSRQCLGQILDSIMEEGDDEKRSTHRSESIDREREVVVEYQMSNRSSLWQSSNSSSSMLLHSHPHHGCKSNGRRTNPICFLPFSQDCLERSSVSNHLLR